MTWRVVLLSVSLYLGGGVVRADDARSELSAYHEEAVTWFEDGLEAEGRSWGSIDRREFEALTLAVLCATPRRLAECFFENRVEFGGGTWRFFPYQLESIDYPYSVVNESGKGTGKTRELAAIIVHSLLHGGSVLFGSPTGTAISNIWEELRWLVHKSRAKDFLAQICTRFTTGNLRIIEGPYGNSARFHTTVRDGDLFQSLHIGLNGKLIADEAALWPDDSWEPFLSRAEAGCTVRIYSVPNPRSPDCRFFELADNAIPIETARLVLSSGRPQVTPKGTTIEPSDIRVEFAYVHWERTMMPPPHWDAPSEGDRGENWRKAVRDYGEEAGAKFQIYVLGRRAVQMGTTFPAHRLLRAFVPMPGYRIVRLVWAPDHVRVTVDEASANGRYTVRTKDTVIRAEGDSAVAVDVEAIAALLPELRGVVTIGVDAGRNQDPTEILALLAVGDGLRVGSRIELLYAPTGFQWRLLAHLFGALRPRVGVAIEASGASHGQAIADNLLDKACGALPSQKVLALEWRSTETVIDEGRKLERHKKEGATVEIERLLERQEQRPGVFLLPDCDQDLKRQILNHKTVGEGPKGRKFQKTLDDIVEALRAGVYFWARRPKGRFRPGSGVGVASLEASR